MAFKIPASVKEIVFSWLYKDEDPRICCCGSYLGDGGDICHHGGCRSLKEYTITCASKG